MAEQVTNYQCPACTGPLHFEGTTGKLECEYCGSSFTVEEIEALFAEKEKKAEQAYDKEKEKQEKEKQEQQGEEGWDDSQMEDWGAEGDKMRAYNCPSCGAQIICDETTVATSCPYCGNPTVVPGTFHGTQKPEYVLPFKLNKERAVEVLKGYYKGKKYLPRVFKDENHIQEIKGMYVPFWLFDGEADADVHYHGTTSVVHRSGDYNVTTTSHFDVRRAGTVVLEKIPVDASKKMPDEYMDSIEPFSYEELQKFSTAYLPGYFADQYDVSLEESAKRADLRAENTAIQTMRQDVGGYQTCTVLDKNVKLRRSRVSYALLPVWMLTTKWRGQIYMFAINGQTGKVTGELPVEWNKFWRNHIGGGAAAMLLLSLILYFL